MIEKVRSVEVRHQDIVDQVGIGGALRWIGDLHEVFKLRVFAINDLAVRNRDPGGGNEPVPAGVGQHLENLVRRGEGPRGPGSDESVGLVMVGLMKSQGIVELRVVSINHENRPHARFDRFRIGKRHNRRADIPDWLEIALDLQVNRCGDSGKVGQRDRIRSRGKSNTFWDHLLTPNIANSSQYQRSQLISGSCEIRRYDDARVPCSNTPLFHAPVQLATGSLSLGYSLAVVSLYFSAEHGPARLA